MTCFDQRINSIMVLRMIFTQLKADCGGELEAGPDNDVVPVSDDFTKKSWLTMCRTHCRSAFCSRRTCGANSWVEKTALMCIHNALWNIYNISSGMQASICTYHGTNNVFVFIVDRIATLNY